MHHISHSRGRQDFFGLHDEIPGSKPSKTLSRSSLPSQPHSITGSGHLEESSRLPSVNAYSGSDQPRVTMKTRVAIRDKSPHRFQVVPLRDVSKSKTSSSSHSENASGLYMSSTLNRKTLHPPSKRLVTLNQTRQSPSSASLGGRLDKLLKEDIRHGSRTELGLELDETFTESSLATSNNKTIQNSGLHTSLSSIALPRQQVLSELDTNVLPRRRVSLRKISDDQVASSSSLSSSESIVQLIHSESPLNHTISRSLQVRTRRERNHPKFSSLSHFQPPDVSQLIPATSTNRRVRTKSDANIPSRFTDSFGSKDDSYYALLDAYDAVDTKSKRRHAIYTPTLYVPSFDQTFQFQENTDTSLDRINWQSVPIGCEPSYGLPHQVNLKADRNSRFESRAVPHHKTPEHDIDIEDDGSQALQHSPKDLSETRTDEPIDHLPVTTSEHRLKHKSSSHSLRLRLPSEELNFPKILQKERHPITLDSPRLGEVVYPRIVLDLLADIDKAIEDWNCIL